MQPVQQTVRRSGRRTCSAFLVNLSRYRQDILYHRSDQLNRQNSSLIFMLLGQIEAAYQSSTRATQGVQMPELRRYIPPEDAFGSTQVRHLIPLELLPSENLISRNF